MKNNHTPQLQKSSYTSFDGDHFGYRKWGSSSDPHTVIIGVHGINGAAADYDNLAEHLTQHVPNTTLYAPETRGQGNDPKKKRRGDIYRPEEWYNDLYTFTRLIRKQHPNSRIIWCGESMGSLIVTHAYAQRPSNEEFCDAIILLAPVVKIGDQVPSWKISLAKCIAAIFPRIRVSLNTLSGEDAVKVTQHGDSHEDQASTNSYYIPKFTLRLLATLGKHIEGMNKKAESFTHPVLVINGGKDYFTQPEFVEEFFKHIPTQIEKKHAYYPRAYHLLMYDEQKAEIFTSITDWLREIEPSYSK
eukprot:Seg20837.1 transcript_id=Seg20837.1/GoldUCD/mRNA.D3Y31 product="Monoacylglycerol lipase" protein_id=Seg20837.1/GoldUCD/D3Y31